MTVKRTMSKKRVSVLPGIYYRRSIWQPATFCLRPRRTN